MRRVARIRTFTLLAGFALLAALLPLTAALVAMVTATTNQSDERAGGALQTVARQIGNQLNRELLQHWRAHTALAEFAASGSSSAALRSQLDTVKLLSSDLAWSGLAAPDGRVLISTAGVLQGHDVAARPWFRAGLQGSYAGDMHRPLLLARHLPPPPDGEPTRLIDFASPVRRADGSILGVMGTHLDVRWLRKLVREALPAEQGLLMLVARDGTVLAGPGGLEGQRLAARAVLAAQQGVAATSTETWQDGGSYLTAAVPIEATDGRPSFGWSIVIRRTPPRMAPLAHELWRTIGMPLVGASAFVLVVGLVLVRRVTRPLQLLSAAAAALSQGRSDGASPEVHTTVELSMLADALARLDQAATPRAMQLHGTRDTAVAETTAAMPQLAA